MPVSVYEFGPYSLSVEQLLLLRDGEPVALGPKVVETLLALIERAGDVVTKTALVERIWPEGFVEEANLAQNVHILRKTFRHHGVADPIETVPRRGYRFTAPVRGFTPVPVVPVVAEPPAVAPARPSSRTMPAMARQFAAAAAGFVFVAAALTLAATSGFGHRDTPRAVLSDDRAQLYQIGRYYWNLRTRDGVRKSLDYFTRYVDADPRDARGYAALADANVAIGDYCYGTHQPPVYFARARAYASKALALDPNSVEAHATLGFLALDGGNAPRALAELQRAIALDPTYAPAHEWYGIALVGRGDLAEGLRQLKLAADLDPLAVTTTAWLASAAYASGRYHDAVVYAYQTLELSPRRTDALMTLGAAYEAQGELDRAIDTFARYGAVGPYYRPEAAVLLARAYARKHRLADARRELAYARAHATELLVNDLAAAASAVGEPTLARAVLRRVRGHRLGTEDAARAFARSSALRPLVAYAR